VAHGGLPGGSGKEVRVVPTARPTPTCGWQIVPRRFVALIGDDDPKKVKAVTDAMMKMVRLVV
jgi:hypothetical protein